MRHSRFLAVALSSVSILACGSQSGASRLEENKALVRQWLQEFDAGRGSLEVIDEWMTPDLQARINSPDAMDLAGYRQLMSSFVSAFSNMRHEIHYMVAENDLVAVGTTLHITHTGEYEGIAPTGRAISIQAIVVVRLRDGKIAEEWLVVDFAALRQQLEAAVAASR